MDKLNLLVRNEYEANKFASKMLLGTAVLDITALILVILGAFGGREGSAMTQVFNYSVGAVVMLVPVLLVLVFKLEFRWIKYVVVTSAGLSMALINFFTSTGNTNSLTTIWVFCVFVANLYFSEKLSWYSLILLVGLLTASDVLIKESAWYTALLGRGLENGPLMLVCITLSKRAKTLLTNMVKSEEEQGKTLQRMGEIIKKSSEVSSVLAQSVEQLSEITSMASNASEQVAENASKVASDSDNTLKQVSEASEAVMHISENLTQIASESGLIAEISEEFYQTNKSSHELMKNAMEEMQTVEKTTRESMNIVYKLGEQSNEIGNIVEVITAIAAQTNLLALNAAIESARAGEQGKGFAVVSEEIRKLAEQAGKAAKDISDIIKKVVVDTESAVSSMEKGAGMVEKGLDSVRAAGVAFEKGSRTGVEVNNRIQAISKVTRKISESGDKIVNIVEEIKSINTNSMGELQGIAAASEQQLASMEQVEVSVGTIGEMSRKLTEAIKSE